MTTNSNRGEGYDQQPGRFDSLDRADETPADLPERLASQLGTALDREPAIDSPPKPTHHSGTDLPAGLITRQTHSPTEPGGRGVLARLRRRMLWWVECIDETRPYHCPCCGQIVIPRDDVLDT